MFYWQVHKQGLSSSFVYESKWTNAPSFKEPLLGAHSVSGSVLGTGASAMSPMGACGLVQDTQEYSERLPESVIGVMLPLTTCAQSGLSFLWELFLLIHRNRAWQWCGTVVLPASYNRWGRWQTSVPASVNYDLSPLKLCFRNAHQSLLITWTKNMWIWDLWVVISCRCLEKLTASL